MPKLFYIDSLIKTHTIISLTKPFKLFRQCIVEHEEFPMKNNPSVVWNINFIFVAMYGIELK
jgi:hypothetical protein